MAEAMGVDTARTKIVIFLIAALLRLPLGLAVCPPAALREPDALRPAHRHRVPLHGGGGRGGHVWGALVGAGVITMLKQWLQDWLPKIFGQSGNFEVIFFGILLILVLQRARDGLWPWLARLVPVRPGERTVAEAAPLPRRPMPAAGTVLLEVK
jgi:ABC-type branched-subunit amino acid transport system permease subunit